MLLKEFFKNWFFKRDLKTRIFLVVLAFHLSFIAYFQISAYIKSYFQSEPIKKHVVVKTIKLKPAPSVKTVNQTTKLIAASTNEITTQDKQSDKVDTKPKVIDKKIINAKKQDPKTTDKNKTKQPAKASYSSSEVQKALKSLESIQIPAPNINLPSVDFESNENEVLDEAHRLGAFLHTWLQLPEFGKVTVRVKVNNEGKVLNIETLESESDRNRIYVEQNLCLLTLPVAKNEGARQSERSLVLVLSNE